MLVIEDHCVNCQIPCINCGLKHQEVIRCDANLCDNRAHYTVTGDVDGDFCEECLEQLLDDIFADMSISEKFDLLKDIITASKI